MTELQLCKKRVEEVEGQNAQYQIEVDTCMCGRGCGVWCVCIFYSAIHL